MEVRTMNKHARLMIMSTATILVFILSLASPIRVLADDAAPPPETASTSEAPTADSPTSEQGTVTEASTVDESSTVEIKPMAEDTTGDAAPVAESASTETAPAEEVNTGETAPAEQVTTSEAAARDQATSEPAPEVTQPSTTELLAEAPEGTQIVVLDENGANVPMATEEAAQIVATGDPVWCPSGVLPGGTGCTTIGSYTSLSALVAGIPVPTGNGVIWIEGGADPGLAVTIDGGTGGNWETAANFSLTLRGGWNGLAGGVTHDYNPSIFDTSISIINWNASVTLSDIQILGVTTGDGLQVETSKDITLTRVHSDGNTGKGAHLNNTINSGTGKVIITAGQFNTNGGTFGLEVISKGTITLNSVTASSNTAGGGASLQNVLAGSAMAITLTGKNSFSSNFGSGLLVDSRGAISAYSLNASGNGTVGIDSGAILNNAYGGATSGVTLTVFGNFNGNYFNGLVVQSHGAIKLNTVTAHSNLNGEGAHLDNCIWNGSNCEGLGGVALTSFNEFDNNKVTGLFISSTGLISLNELNANGTTNGKGAEINNAYSGFSSGVMLTGANNFNSNYDTGLDINSNGTLSLNNLTANSNGLGASSGYGADLNNTGASPGKSVTLTGINTFNGNYDGGLAITSVGTISASNLTAGGNLNGDGASLDNDGAASAMNVTLTGLNTFNNNAANGLNVSSIGAISATQLIADYNTLDGVYLDNCVDFTPCRWPVAKSITISRFGEFTDNGHHGLDIDATGAVILNNLTATSNGLVSGWDGVIVENTWFGAGAAGVTLNGFNNFNSNSWDGLSIDARGAVTLNGINNFNSNTNNGLFVSTLGAIKVNNASAIGNGWGFDLSNETAPIPQNVTIAGFLKAISNTNRGLWIRSDGAVSAANLITNDNGLEGTRIYNVGANSLKPVTITGTNAFNSNDGVGLHIASSGAVTLNNVTALWNGFVGDYSGVYVNNRVDTTIQQNVTLNGTNVFNHNSLHGLQVFSFGAVTLNNVTANNNGAGVVNSGASPCTAIGCGVFIFNSDGTYAKAVLIKGINSFNQNDASGLGVTSNGAITLYNVTASDNDQMGIYLFNDNFDADPDTPPAYPQVQSKVYLYGYGLFERNGWDGLYISSSGAVTTNNLTADSNTGTGSSFGNGVYIDTKGLSGPQAVTLNGNNLFTFNGTTGVGSGLVILSDGTIKVNNLNAGYNQFKGALLDNYTNWAAPYPPLTPFLTYGSVTLTGFGNFTGNFTGDGLSVKTHGSVTLNRISAYLNGNDYGTNGDDGFEILADGKVTLVCSVAYGNYTDGLFVRTSNGIGSVSSLTLKGFFAYENGNLYTNGGLDENFGSVILVRSACP
jgi:hypothetical protein